MVVVLWLLIQLVLSQKISNYLLHANCVERHLFKHSFVSFISQSVCVASNVCYLNQSNKPVLVFNSCWAKCANKNDYMASRMCQCFFKTYSIHIRTLSSDNYYQCNSYVECENAFSAIKTQLISLLSKPRFISLPWLGQICCWLII